MIEEGKTYLYKGELVTISAFNKIEDEYVISLSNGEVFTCFARTLEATLNEKLKPFDGGVEIARKEENSAVLAGSLSGSIGQLKDVLMNNIEKVQNDKSYVSQAKEVNNSIKEIINLAKVDIEYRKLAKGI